MSQDKQGCGAGETMGHGERAVCGQSFYGSPWYCSACTQKAAVAAAVAAERAARQAAQIEVERLQERINHADKEKAQAVEAERISAANVCLEMAERMERAAGICAANGEADEVSPLRSTAWQLTVAAELIKKGRASIFDAAIRST